MQMKVVTIRPRDLNDVTSSEYQSIFTAWRDIWAPEYQSLGLGKLHSDNFTRQDEIVAFFIDDQCASLCCYRAVDLSSEAGQMDSWLDKWPTDLMNRLASQNRHCLIASAFCITKDFRRQTILGHTMKEWLAASVTHYMIHHTNHNAMLGSMRNLRGTNTAVTAVGAEVLQTIEINNEPTDLVVFIRSHLPALPADMEFQLRRGWQIGATKTEKKAA